MGLGDIWSGWYVDYRGRKFVKLTTSQQLEVRLWGFARASAEQMLFRVRQRLTAVGLPGDCARLRNPDTLNVTFPPAPFRSRWPLAAIDGLLAETNFAGFDIEARFSMREGGSKRAIPTWTLVARGLIRKGELLLRALYQADEGEAVERIYQRTVWRAQADCLEALNADVSSPALPAGIMLHRPGAERFGLRATRLLLDLPGDNKVVGFLRRLGIWGALTAGFLLITVHCDPVLTAVCGLFTLIAGFGLVFTAGVKVAEVIILHRWAKTGLQSLYSQRLTCPPVDLVVEGVADNPLTAKYSRELEAHGAVHYFDSISPSTAQKAFIRCYLLPDDRTYLMLNIILTLGSRHCFPAKPLFVATTFFSDGHMLQVGNSELRLRKPRDASVSERRHPGVNRPADFIARCRDESRKFLDAGKELASILTPQDLIAKLAELHETTGERLARHGYYSWREAIVQSFLTPARDEL